MSGLTIAIVAEGDTDTEMITALVREIIPGEHRILPLQPEISETEGLGNGNAGRHGGGWKGVMSWCKKTTEEFGSITAFMNSLSPKIDLLIIHLDADVAREAKINCYEPCPHVINTVNNLKARIQSWLNITTFPDEIVCCIPCDNTEAWVLCAFDPTTPHHDPPTKYLECLPDPDEEISKQGYNRPRRLLTRKSNGKPRKTVTKYRIELIPQVLANWEQVKQICSQAQAFEQDLTG